MSNPTPTIRLICFLLAGCIHSAKGQAPINLWPEQPGCLVVTGEIQTLPRPNHIYYLYIDLTCSDLEVFTLAGKDPDGPGPAESALTSPDKLVQRSGALAAINANAFAGLPGTENDIRGWYADRPVDILGMVVSDGRVISRAHTGRTAFWLDARNRPHLGDPEPTDTVLQAISDWQMPLLKNGEVLPKPAVTTLHPRSALGFDDTGRWLLLVVADGRQPGYSEGLSLYELALVLQAKGCTQAINLDGGGSSILMATDGGRKVKTLNRPSGISHRPVPVMLGVRKKKVVRN